MAAFQKKYDRAPTGVAMEAYDTLGVVVAAIQKANSVERKDVINGLEEVSWVGVNGTYSFPSTKEPAWAFHQFMGVPFHIIQYSAVNQPPGDAPIGRFWGTREGAASRLPGRYDDLHLVQRKR